MSVLGLDLGTTSTKAVAFGADGTPGETVEDGYETDEPHPGWATQDAATVRETALRVLRTALGDGVEAVACSTAMHSLVGVAEDGEPVTELLTWGDLRATHQAERIRAAHPELHEQTGTPIHPFSPLCKLVWFRESEPETFARVERWVGVKELVVHALTGEWVMDHSVASGSGLLDVRTLDWHPLALELAGVGPARLPRLAPTKTVLDAGLGVPLVLGAGDGPLANLGLGAIRPGVAACSIGTSGALRLAAEAPRVDARRRLFSYALTPERWVLGGAINNGGNVLEWAGETLAPELAGDEAALLALAAKVTPGCDGLVMLPYLLSERAPHWSALPRGAYVGLSSGHGRGHLVRAAVEGVCQQLGLVLASLRDAGNEVREIRATGGFAQSALWRQMLADVLGMPVGFPDGHQGSAFGAALLGMDALDLADTIDVAAELVSLGEVVEPDPAAAAAYAELQPTFAGLYDALVPAFTELRTFRDRHR